jgi:hypothetical protein
VCVRQQKEHGRVCHPPGNSETITHEGAHVGDDMNFLNSGYNPMLNLAHGQTEFNAFKAGAEINHQHGFGPNDDQKIWNFLRTSPVYGPILNVPVFNPNRFPIGVPPLGALDDDQ